MPQQYRLERIRRPDVQTLLRKVFIHPDEAYSARFPNEMPAHVRITLQAGDIYEREVTALEPPYWEWSERKFESLASAYASAAQRAAITDIADFEHVRISELMNVLAAAAISQPVRPSAA